MKIVTKDVQVIIRNVVKDFTDFVAKTYGPAGKTILLSDGIAVDDGKLVAQDYELENETEQSIINHMMAVAEKTDVRVGDGTTTATILAGSIVEEALKQNNEFSAINVYSIVKELKQGLSEAIEQIKAQSKPIKTKKDLYAIAYNSFNNEEIANLISEALFKIGAEGVVSLEDSPTVKTECEIVGGFELGRGYASSYFINSDDKVVLKNPRIMLVNGKITNIKSIAELMKKIVMSSNKNIVIIADEFSEEIINIFVINKMQGSLNPLLIENPAYGDNKLEILKDIASVVNTKVIDEKTGIALELVTEDSLGTCSSIVSRKYSTIISGGNKDDKRVKELKDKLIKSNDEMEKQKLSKRIASLESGVAVLKIGAYTESEQKTKKLKAEDAINATSVAFKDGVVAGAGRTFEKIKTSSDILNKALKQPRKRLEDNGIEWLDDNVKDPTGVLIAALESATSIAISLLNLGGTIVAKREKKDKIDY